MDLTIFCLLPGGDSPFPVDIPETRTVGHLKDVIKLKNPQTLSNVEAWRLSLHLVEIDATDVRKAIAEAETIFQTLRTLTVDSVEFLNPTRCLSTVFKSRGHTRESIHILVVPPRSEP